VSGTALLEGRIPRRDLEGYLSRSFAVGTTPAGGDAVRTI